MKMKPIFWSQFFLKLTRLSHKRLNSFSVTLKLETRLNSTDKIIDTDVIRTQRLNTLLIFGLKILLIIT